MKITWKMPHDDRELFRFIVFLISCIGSFTMFLGMYITWEINLAALRFMLLCIVLMIGSGIRINEDKP